MGKRPFADEPRRPTDVDYHPTRVVRSVLIGLVLFGLAAVALVGVGWYYQADAPTREELGRRMVEENPSPQSMQTQAKLKEFPPLTPERAAELRDTIAVVETDYGRFAIELLPDVAPQSVQSFVYLVENGFYDGQLLAGGKPMEQIAIDGVPTDEKFFYRIRSEFSTEQETAGAVLVERVVDPAFANGRPEDETFLNSGSSRMWILIKPKPPDTPRFTVFGRVVAGMDVVAQISMTWVKGLPDFARELLVYRVRLIKRSQLASVMQEPVAEPGGPPWWAQERTRLPM
jgi:cyclophilin family peptidyl-prolyl cis-trans isomerase